ncbi:hypothetical protein FA15DRAFT_760571 [Coprinopsis marcescibilis]|uniref:26S proteasome regulatory subunit Rpn7 N-terminal domain-containing protein n=1 Tax=Coprinopsis marcescibilis TaxID=230819 RepID=A0A5C3KF49_COPMA|nr:hypothetical protein FA15DRAFT_760571 [Coprinopsis marcescibilis]
MSEETVLPIPNLTLPQNLFRLEEGKKREGETEISEALKAQANYPTRIGDKDKALEAQVLVLEKTPGLGSRIDIVLTIVRIGFFFADNVLITAYMQKAEKFIDEGSDWDRRNRLKAYTAVHLISIRQFKLAANLFLDALSTLTTAELISFNDLVAMAVISGTSTLSCPDLKKRVISAPEVNQVVPELPVLQTSQNLYKSHYYKFFKALATLEQTILLPSRILNPHARHYLCEMHILAYTQLLESDKSLTLTSLSAALVSGKPLLRGEPAFLSFWSAGFVFVLVSCWLRVREGYDLPSASTSPSGPLWISFRSLILLLFVRVRNSKFVFGFLFLVSRFRSRSEFMCRL